MDEIAEKIELRNRVMRRCYLALAPHERIERMRQLHQWGLDRLRHNPSGLANFIRRNFARRAIARPYDL